MNFPYQMVSLLELLELNAEAFCRLSSMVGQLVIVLAQGGAPDTAVMGATLAELQNQAVRLGWRSVSQQMDRIKEQFLKGNTSGQIMHGMVLDLYNRLRDDLDDRFFLIIASEHVEFYRQPKPLFGDEVEKKFSSSDMSEDISEAAKCLALNRSTATVFHLMRVMEIGLQKFGDKLGVSLTGEKNWQNILDEVNKAIKALDQKAAQTKAYAAASAHLYNVKLAWRNEVMHPKQTYTPEEALRVFRSVDTFIRDLAGMI